MSDPYNDALAFAIGKVRGHDANDPFVAASQSLIQSLRSRFAGDDGALAREDDITLPRQELLLLLVYAQEQALLAQCAQVMADAFPGTASDNVVSFPSKAFPRGLPPSPGDAA